MLMKGGFRRSISNWLVNRHSQVTDQDQEHDQEQEFHSLVTRHLSLIAHRRLRRRRRLHSVIDKLPDANNG